MRVRRIAESTDRVARTNNSRNKDEQAILIVMQAAVAGSVTLAANLFVLKTSIAPVSCAPVVPALLGVQRLVRRAVQNKV